MREVGPEGSALITMIVLLANDLLLLIINQSVMLPAITAADTLIIPKPHYVCTVI